VEQTISNVCDFNPLPHVSVLNMSRNGNHIIGTAAIVVPSLASFKVFELRSAASFKIFELSKFGNYA